MKRWVGSIVILMALCGAVCFAQVAGGQQGKVAPGTPGGILWQAPGGTGRSGVMSMSLSRTPLTALTGAPYYGEEVSETVQTLADGTRITRKNMAQKTWRDFEGRTRTERQMGGQLRPNAPQLPAIVEIRDPVEGVLYVLDTQGKVAHRVKTDPAPGGGPSVVWRRPAGTAAASTRIVRSSSTTSDGVEMLNESLGDQLIEGVICMGTRITSTYPAGSQGNDRPITTVRESWYSRELGLTLLTKSLDPRSGEMAQKMMNISRLEPDANLFRPPADYQIVEETGSNLTIRYNLQ